MVNNIAKGSSTTWNNLLAGYAPASQLFKDVLSCLNCLVYHFLSRYMPHGLQSPAQDQIHSLRLANPCFHAVRKQLPAVRLGLQFHRLRAIEQYQDALFEGAFHMQLPVDSVACNKDTVLSLRSSSSSVVFFFQVV